MLLIARGGLPLKAPSQSAIAGLDKSAFVKTPAQLFENFMHEGFLLLNATLSLTAFGVAYDARQWRPFLACLLEGLSHAAPTIKLVLLGNIAQKLQEIPAAQAFSHFRAEHPYNISFITNPAVLNFFRPFDLLTRSN
jgi:uracil-DNA glycosylase